MDSFSEELRRVSPNSLARAKPALATLTTAARFVRTVALLLFAFPVRPITKDAK